MIPPRTVVAKAQRVSKQQLHADLMVGWARAIAAKGGVGAFCDHHDITQPALKKQQAGSMPGFELIISALQDDGHVLDEVMARIGKRVSDQNAECDADDLSRLLARVLLLIAEAEHPDSPGGRAIVHQEYLGGEDLMRQVHCASGKWLERCAEIRTPRVVA